MKRSRHAKSKLLIPNKPAMRRGSPLFKPDYSPVRMLKLGVFGGNYFADAKPEDFDGLGAAERLATLNRSTFDPRANCFGVKAGLPYIDWYNKGWMHEDDPLGWFHWYCRYYAGRRHSDDSRQIGRWVAYKQRWGDRLQSQFDAGRPSAVVMQGLLQWGIDPYLGRD